MLDGKTHSLLLKCFFPAFFVLIKKKQKRYACASDLELATACNWRLFSKNSY